MKISEPRAALLSGHQGKEKRSAKGLALRVVNVDRAANPVNLFHVGPGLAVLVMQRKF